MCILISIELCDWYEHMIRVNIQPKLLSWARERLGRDALKLQSRFKKLPLWENGQEKPTLKQLEAYAAATYVPIGYFFLPTPPEEKLPIPDLRTIRNKAVKYTSPDLLDIVYTCQQRQAWFRDYALITGQSPLPFVGSATTRSSVVTIAKQICETLRFDLEARRNCPTWSDALRQFIRQSDDVGVLTMVSGVVGANSHRKLNVEEFRGLALSDPLAPLVFINGADSKAAQMFTLAHELAHIWLGENGVSDVNPTSRPTDVIENWCNQVAAEILVPLDILRQELSSSAPLDNINNLARRFKVSTLVILRRILDAGSITWDVFQAAYQNEITLLRKMMRGKSGGNFYLAQSIRVSRRFARALVADTLEGRTLFRDAYQMLGVKNQSAFEGLGKTLGLGI